MKLFIFVLKNIKKKELMAIITLRYDSRNPLAKKTIDFILSLGIFEKRTELDESLEDVKKGKVHSAKSAEDLIKQCSK